MAHGVHDIVERDTRAVRETYRSNVAEPIKVAAEARQCTREHVDVVGGVACRICMNGLSHAAARLTNTYLACDTPGLSPPCCDNGGTQPFGLRSLHGPIGHGVR